MVNKTIVKYIKEQIKNGYDAQVIRGYLLKYGYSPSDVDEAIRAVYSPEVKHVIHFSTTTMISIVAVFVSIQEVPTELDPITLFVSQCLDDVSANGLQLIGEHGGYIDIDDTALTKEIFKISQNPTDSEAVIFAPGSDLKTAYWWYLESDNKCEGTCTFKSKQPPLREKDNSIEKQLNRYIEKELPACIDNFKGLIQQGFEVNELSSIKADTRIAESDVVVVLDYNLEVKKGDVTSNIEQFFVRIPVNLQKIYNLATEITNLEQQYHFLERQTMNLISSFSSVDEDKLPPITDMRFEFGSTTSWRKSDVQDKVAQILSTYIPLFQVDGTRNFDQGFYASELKQRLYDSMIIPVADPQYSNLDVNFNYLNFWPIYFDLNCNGENCQPDSASGLLSFIGLQRYNFAYDVSFPTLVEIYDEAAFNNQGYRFNFFLEANVRNNKELLADFAPLQTASFPQTSLLCDLDNRNSANVTVNTFDSSTSRPLPDVSVALTVAGESCYIGNTDQNGSLVTKFPAGTIGSVVSFLKRDYLSTAKLFDARIDKKTFLEAELFPINNKKIVVKKKLVEKTNRGWEFTNTVADLKPNEEATVILRRISSLTDEDLQTTVILQGPTEGEIRLSPGKYEADINMFLRERLIIPPRQITKRVGLFSKKTFTIPGHEFNENSPYPSGGLKLNITITEEDMKKDTIVLYAINFALDRVPEQQRAIEDLTQIAKVEEYSKIYASLLQPTFQ